MFEENEPSFVPPKEFPSQDLSELNTVNSDKSQPVVDMFNASSTNQVSQPEANINPLPQINPTIQTMPVEHLQNHSTGSKMKILIFVVVVILLLAAGGAGAFYYYNQMMLPAKAFSAALTKMGQMKSGKVSAELVIDAKIKSYPQEISTDSLTGSTTASEQKYNLKLTNQTSFSKVSDDFYQSMTESSITLPDQLKEMLGGNGTLQLSTISADKNKLFLKVGGLDLAPVQYSFLNNLWIAFDVEAVQEQYLHSTTTFDNKAAVNDIIKIYQKNSFVVLKMVGQEDVSGTPSDHYSASVDKDKLKQFILQANQLAKEKYQGQASSVDNVSASQIDEYLAGISVDGDFWISRQDGYFTKTKINFIFNNYNGTEVNTDLTLAFSDYNQTITITAPTNFKTSNEVISEIMGNISLMSPSSSVVTSTLSTSTLSSLNQNVSSSSATSSQIECSFEGSKFSTAPNKIDLTVDSDKDGLPDYWEKFFGTDPNKVDTDGDGHKDFDEIKNGYSPTNPKPVKLDLAKLKSDFLSKAISPVLGGACGNVSQEVIQQYKNMTDVQVYNKILELISQSHG